SMLSKEEALRDIWKSPTPPRINTAVVREFFRQRTHDLIDIVKPKLILCLGNTAYHGLTYQKPKGETYSTSAVIRGAEYEVYGFSRLGTWTARLDKIGQDLSKCMKK